MISTGISVLAGGLLLVLYLGYRAFLPKPLPDIPYNKDAALKLFGDVPEVMNFVKTKKQIFTWFATLTAKHNSPIAQAFIKPGSLPWVVVTDPYEIQDILLRRTKEFDRASFFHDVLNGIINFQASQYVSDHPIFKHNRNLINHLMAPSFVYEIIAPEVYNSIITLIKVWQVKCDKSQGAPFPANHDITYQALDFIFAALFEVKEQDSITVQGLKTVSEWTYNANTDTIDTPVSFPDGAVPQVQAALLTLTNSIMHTQLSPFPTLTSTIHTKFPSMRRAIATKEAFIRGKINESIALIAADEKAPARNAIHSVLLREKETADKENRQPDYHQRGIYDEFVGLVMAGHDTSATTVSWGVKYLTAHQDVQNRLRKELKKAFPEAVPENRPPSYQELVASHIPYLNAVVEEVLRLSNSIDFVVRVALKDTTILGRRIPKGTDVFLMANGAGFIEGNMLKHRWEDDEIRSPGARKKNGKMLSGLWEDDGIGMFKPERWLKVVKDGESGEDKEVFDSLAGPTLAFGLGPRGCFGKRLALVSLRMHFALIVWHFELKKTPEGLSSFNAVQRFAREPEMCYVRLGEVDMREV